MTRRAALVAGAVLAAACAKPKPTGHLGIAVTDDTTHQPLAARVALFDDAKHELVHFGALDLYGQRQGAGACVVGPGVYATWTGIVLAKGVGSIPVGTGKCMLRPGKYRAVVWHGIDYDRAEVAELDATGPSPALSVALHRAFTPKSALAADLHVHGAPSDDSDMPDDERVAAQLASGLQVIGFANHNVSKDLADAIRRLGVGDRIVSIPSVELTSEQFHLGAYPVPVDQPLDKDAIVAADVPGLFRIAKALPGKPIIQVNHPRFRYGALFDLVGWNDVAWPPPFPLDFDALEVVAGYQAFNVPKDRRTDDTVRDLYALAEHGKVVAAMGNSDTHDFTWVLDGTARTFVTVPTALAQPFDRGAFLAAIRARKTLATTCPYFTVAVSGTHVAVDIFQANFCRADHLDLTVNARRVLRVPIAPGTASHWEGDLPGVYFGADAWIGAVVWGDTPLPLEQTGSYQRDKWKHPGVVPYAVISPILVDADHDGHWRYAGADLLLDAFGQ